MATKLPATARVEIEISRAALIEFMRPRMKDTDFRPFVMEDLKFLVKGDDGFVEVRDTNPLIANFIKTSEL